MNEIDPNISEPSPTAEADKGAKEEILERAKKGDKAALQAIISEHQAQIYRVIYRQTRDRELALELTQDTFVKAVRAIQHVRNPHALSAWIHQIALNLVRNHFKSRIFSLKLRTTSIDPSTFEPPAPDPNEPLAQKYDVERALALLSELKPQQREIVTLCMLERRAYREVAEILDIPMGTVGSRLNNALRALRALYFGEQSK